MANTPAWASLPVIGMVQIATANTNVDGSGTLGTLLTGDATGTPVVKLRVVAAGNTTAGMIRFFLVNGGNTRLFAELRVTPITQSGTVKCYEGEVDLVDFGLPDNNWVIKCSTHVAETFNVYALGGKL